MKYFIVEPEIVYQTYRVDMSSFDIPNTFQGLDNFSISKVYVENKEKLTDCIFDSETYIGFIASKKLKNLICELKYPKSEFVVIPKVFHKNKIVKENYFLWVILETASSFIDFSNSSFYLKENSFIKPQKILSTIKYDNGTHFENEVNSYEDNVTLEPAHIDFHGDNYDLFTLSNYENKIFASEKAIEKFKLNNITGLKITEVLKS